MKWPIVFERMKTRVLLACILILSMAFTYLPAPPVSAADAAEAPLPVFREDFGDGNADGWTTYGSNNAGNRGTWSVNIGNQYTVSGSPGAKSVALGTSFKDLVYEADLAVNGINSDQTGLLFRVTNATGDVSDGYNGYFAALRVDKKIMLSRVTGAKGDEYKELTTADFPMASAHLKVVAVGNRIQVFADNMNVPLIDYTDNDGKQITTAGAIGIRTWWGTSVIDNIEVRAYSENAAAAPVIGTPSGVYEAQQLVTITADPDAAIRYTLDGSAPNAESPVYTNPIAVSSNTIIRAYAEKAGQMASRESRAEYFIAGSQLAYTNDFADGAAEGWTNYAGNGQQPDIWSVTKDVYQYQAASPKGAKSVIDAVYADFELEADVNPQGANGNDSGFVFRVSEPGNGADKMNGYYAGISAAGFVIAGKMSAQGNGVWTQVLKIPAAVSPKDMNRLKVIASDTHYFIYLNGKYVADFTDSTYTTGTVGLRAWNDNGPVTFDNVSVNRLTAAMLQVAAPVFNPAPGTFAVSQTVSIESATPGAVIHYTTDGSVPNASSPVYDGPIVLKETATVKAYASLTGMTDSPVASAAYTKLSHEFTENFDVSNTDGSAVGWTTYQGAWKVSGNVYHLTTKGPGFKSVADGTNFANFVYEADVTLKDGTNSDNAGLIFRVSDPASGGDNMKGYYAGLTSNGRVQVGRMNNNWTELASILYPVKQNTTYRMKIEARGSHIEVYVDGEPIVSLVDTMFAQGAIGVRAHYVSTDYDNISVQDLGDVVMPTYDWSWVKGAVFVPTNAVNQIQQWDEYDHDINDRELSYAHTYGINFVRVFLHNLLWKDDSDKLLANLEDFLKLADKYGIKVEVVFFDDCWNDYPEMGPQLPPRYGAHNSRWVEAPGDAVKGNYAANKQDLKEYVQGIVNAHKIDERIAFWNIYNEPSNGESGLMDQITKQIMNDARIWIKETGADQPVSSTGGQFSGQPTSDFITWHPYDANYPTPFGVRKDILADELMNRQTQSVPGVVANYGQKGIGYVMWELGIGRDNTRFPWGSDVNPMTSEPAMPFHGIVYPDGHPFDVNDVKALTGDRFNTLPVFNVKYYKDESFSSLAKSSITPRVDFDLGDEKGTGSPDPTVGIGEDHFSIRWSGTIQPAAAGEYSIYADSDNVARVWIDKVKVVDKSSGVREEVSGKISLDAGSPYAVTIEYAHAKGDASMHVRWSGPGIAKQTMLPVYAGKHVEAVSLDTDAFTLKTDETKKLTATLSPADASNQLIVWTSSAPATASVDGSGLVKGLNPGTATITATASDGGASASATVTVTSSGIFKNPIVTVSGDGGSADPSVVFKDGYYYYVKSARDATLQVAKAKRLQDIGTSPRMTVFTPPAGTNYSKELWAPELQYINGKWYIYFAADDGNNANHRMYVLESKTQDPQGEYEFKGKIADPTDKWAIDGTVLQKDDGSLYFVWSGWEGDVNVKQNLYIAPMSNPWTISGPRVQISTPDQTWERNGTPYINEGPEVLKKDGKIFIVYSASGSWTDDYTLGMLTNTDGNVLEAASWKKTGPVFSKAPGAYGPGHNSFTKSPDGKEDWIVYHADLRSGGSWANRSVRAQPFTWNADGTPNFGTPVAYGASIPEPSGTPVVARYFYEAEQGTLGGGARINNQADASGGKVVGNIDNAGTDYLQFNVNVDKAGDYTMVVMASNGTAGGPVAQHDVSVNGGPNQVIDYKSFGWERYNPSAITVTLNKGANTIRLTKKANFAEVDSMILTYNEADAAQEPVSTISGPSSAASGETFGLTFGLRDVSAAGFEKLTAQDLTVTFDPNLMELDDVKSLAAGLGFVQTKVIAPGRVRVLAAALEGELPANGTWLELTFKAAHLASAAQAGVSLSHIVIANTAGEELQVKDSSLHIDIVPASVTKQQLEEAISAARTKHDAAQEAQRHGYYAAGAKATLASAIDRAAAVAADTNPTRQQLSDALVALSAAVAAFDAQKINADLDGSSSVTVGDLAIIAYAYGKRSGSGSGAWDEQAAKADVNHDGVVDIGDLSIAAKAILE